MPVLKIETFNHQIAVKIARNINAEIGKNLSLQLTVFAQSVSMMYVTAFACGFCSAIVLLVSNVYISEIASR